MVLDTLSDDVVSLLVGVALEQFAITGCWEDASAAVGRYMWDHYVLPLDDHELNEIMVTASDEADAAIVKRA